MSVIISNLPDKEKGHWEIVGFPYFFKGNDEYYSKMEIAHKFFDVKAKCFISGEITIIDVPLKMLMDIKIDNHFDCKNKTKIEKKEKRKHRSIFFDSEQNQLMTFDSNRFKKFKRFRLSEIHNGSLYYELPYTTIEEQKDKKKRNIILPSVVVAQTFFFLDSSLIEILFENNLRGILNFYESKKEIIEKENKKIGLFVYNNTDTNKPIREKIAKSVAKFLFSQNDFLLKELKKTNSKHYYSIINNQEVHFEFSIPMRPKFSLKVYGEYYFSEDEIIFYVNEIFHIVTYKDIYEVDEIKTEPKIERSSTDKRDEKEEIIGGRKIVFSKPSPQKPKIITDHTPNSKLGEIDLNEKASVFNFIKISSQKREDQKTKYTPESKSVISQTETTSYNNPQNNESDITKVNSSRTQNKTSEQGLSYLSNIMRRIKENPNLLYEIKYVQIAKPNVYKIFRVINNIGKNIYFIEDIYHDRIQVLFNESLAKLNTDYFNELLDLHEQNRYSWEKIKKNNKKSNGTFFDISVNKQFKDNDIEKGYENILKRIKSVFKD